MADRVADHGRGDYYLLLAVDLGYNKETASEGRARLRKAQNSDELSELAGFNRGNASVIVRPARGIGKKRPGETASYAIPGRFSFFRRIRR